MFSHTRDGFRGKALTQIEIPIFNPLSQKIILTGIMFRLKTFKIGKLPFITKLNMRKMWATYSRFCQNIIPTLTITTIRL